MNDPTAIVGAINSIESPATYSARHLVQDDIDKWLKLDGATWSLSTDSGDCKIMIGVYNQLIGAVVESDNSITTQGGANWHLISSGGFATFAAP